LSYFTHSPKSPRGRICTKFGTAVGVAGVITSNKFFGDRSRGVDSVGVKNCPLPLTKPVAVNTGLALPRSSWYRPTGWGIGRYKPEPVWKSGGPKKFWILTFKTLDYGVGLCWQAQMTLVLAVDWHVCSHFCIPWLAKFLGWESEFPQRNFSPESKTYLE